MYINLFHYILPLRHYEKMYSIKDINVENTQVRVD